MSVAVDDADLVVVAATALDVDPDDLVAAVDVAALERVVASIELATTPVAAASAALVELIRQRPFPTGNRAVAWLAAAHVLAAHDLELHVTDVDALDLVRAVTDRDADEQVVAGALARWSAPRPTRLRRIAVALLHTPTVDGQLWPCPSCARPVAVTRASVGGLRGPRAVAAAPTLQALCARQHGAHDRWGRPPAPLQPLVLEPVSAH